MPLCDALELIEYWNEFPPTHILMRAYVGYKNKPDTDARRELEKIADGPSQSLKRAPAYLQKAAEEMRAEHGRRQP